jgi:signal transduction histidine kinase
MALNTSRGALNLPEPAPAAAARTRPGGHFATWAGNLLTHSKNPGIRFRVALFVVGIAVVFAAILWTAHTSWRRIDELRERLTTVQSESFHMAENSQKAILELNQLLLNYEISPQEGIWTEFLQKSVALNTWIDEQKGQCQSDAEKQLLHKIDTAYDLYLAVSTNLHVLPGTSRNSAEVLSEFSSVKRETDALLQLGIELAVAHRATLASFVIESNHSLARLRAVLLSSLCLLLVFGGGLAAIIYRDLVAPLRVKLVESRALLERQEKLASLGMLAAGVAHEIRNPLTAIKARLFTQQKVLKVGTPEYTDAHVIGQEIDRLERIVRDVLLFARPSDPDLMIVPASQPLRDAEALLTKELEQANIRLVIEVESASRIRIDPPQIKQALINLVQNAAEAIGRNGTILLRSRDGHLPLQGRSQPVVLLEVADTGKGISPEVEKRLFDPFFTTKDAGTGLGLSIAARIVGRHGGALRYQTQVGHGTTFGIVLPRVEADDLPRAQAPD